MVLSPRQDHLGMDTQVLDKQMCCGDNRAGRQWPRSLVRTVVVRRRIPWWQSAKSELPMTGQLVQLPSAATPATSRIITGTDSSPLLYVTGPLYSPRRAFGAFPALIPTFSTRRPITASTTQIRHGSGHPTAIRQRPTTNLHRRLRSSDDDYLSYQYRLACHTTYCIVAALAFVAERLVGSYK